MSIPFLPPLPSRHGTPHSSRRSSAEEKQQTSSRDGEQATLNNSTSHSRTGSAGKHKRPSFTESPSSLPLHQRVQEERKEREMEAVIAAFPSAAKVPIARISVPMPKPLITKPPHTLLSRPPHPSQLHPSSSSTSSPSFLSILPSSSHSEADPSPADVSWERKQATQLGFFRDDMGYARTSVEGLMRDAERRRKEEEKQMPTPPSSSRRIHPSYIPPPPQSSFIPPSSSPSPSLSSSDSPLISSLTQRVMALETLSSHQSLIIQQREAEIRSLQSSLSSSSHTELSALRQQVAEMEKFLSDYGLEWVGENENSASQLSSSSPSALPFSLEAFLARVAELNASLPASALVISRSSSSATFTPPPSLRLLLLSDGISLPPPLPPFLGYASSAGSALLADIMDGYWPGQWKAQWPEGVRLDVEVAVERKWEEEERRRKEERRKKRVKSFHAFEGIGRRINGKDTQPSSHPSHSPSAPLHTQQFLSRLPVSTLVNGRVVDVRSSISRMIGGDEGIVQQSVQSVWDTVPVKWTSVLDQLRGITPVVKPPFPAALPVFALHIHCRCGRVVQSFLLLFKGEEKLVDVSAVVMKYVADVEGVRGKTWKVRWATTYPRVVVEMEEVKGGGAGTVQFVCNENSSLKDLGWTRQCSIFVNAHS